jgi:glycosyltransferase involved in cell wall biosynthesis
MHVAMIIDDERLRQEHTMLNRLAIGLIDQGVRLTRIVPDTIDVEAVWRSEQRIALAPRIEVPLRVLPWMKRTRAATIAEQFERTPPDVTYAVGFRSWPIALDVAKLLEKPVALGIWRASLIRKAARLHSNKHVAAYIAPTRQIAEALEKRVDPDLVSLVPMGVAIPAQRKQVLKDMQQVIGIAAIGSGKDVPGYEAMLGGISRIIRDYPQMQIVLELRGPHQHDIWRIARRLDLLNAISGIEDAAQHRPLLTCCDIMLVPESYGELTSVLIDAMAAGIPIIARQDSFLDMLIDNETALLVSEARAQDWADRLTLLLSNPERALQLGRSAREFVQTHHSSGIQIKRLLETLEQVVSGSSYAFPKSAG